VTRVNFSIPVGGASLVIDQDEKHFQVRLGKWIVEVIGDELVVREQDKPVNETPLLKVPA
jgi:hypothetical protein